MTARAGGGKLGLPPGKEKQGKVGKQTEKRG